jgi:hypothetical protein
MKKLISTLLVLLFSQEFLSDSYEDEVRKRLGLLKNKPIVTMASDSFNFKIKFLPIKPFAPVINIFI